MEDQVEIGSKLQRSARKFEVSSQEEMTQIAKRVELSEQPVVIINRKNGEREKLFVTHNH